jgi:hypothetical protein
MQSSPINASQDNLDNSNISLPPLEALYTHDEQIQSSVTTRSQSTLSQPPPTQSKKSIKAMRKKANKQVDEEGDMTAYTVHVNHKQDDDIFIIDTGCIGSHVFKDKSLVSNMAHHNTNAIKDFSGTSHSSSVRGNLLSTTQKVLVMETSKVNLLSTEQFFRSKRAQFCQIMV